jgi:hypothetical protein
MHEPADFLDAVAAAFLPPPMSSDIPDRTGENRYSRFETRTEAH